MAVTVSGLYVPNFIDVFDASDLAFNLVSTAHKIALLSNAATPNFSSDTGWSSTNEVAGTGWVTGGIALSAAAAGATSTAPTVTESPTGTLMWDMGDVAVSTTTLTNARAGRIYADAVASDPLIILIDFDADYSTVAGTFGIQWAAGGVASIDLTP